MYQLVTTVRETDEGYRVTAHLSEVLPGGGVAPLAERHTAYPPRPERALQDPLVGILQTLRYFAEEEASKSGSPANSQPLF